MKGVCLKFYTEEFQKHHGYLLYEWLLEFAKKHGIAGGSVFRTIGSFGRHGVLHEEHFFELASDVAVEISFVLERDRVELFFSRLKEEKLNLFYTLSEVEFGFLLPSSLEEPTP